MWSQLFPCSGYPQEGGSVLESLLREPFKLRALRGRGEGYREPAVRRAAKRRGPARTSAPHQHLVDRLAVVIDRHPGPMRVQTEITKKLTIGTVSVYRPGKRRRSRAVTVL